MCKIFYNVFNIILNANKYLQLINRGFTDNQIFTNRKSEI